MITLWTGTVLSEKGDVLRGTREKGDSHSSHSRTFPFRIERSLAHHFHHCESLAGAEVLGILITSGFRKRHELGAFGAPAISEVIRRRHKDLSAETEKWLGSLCCATLKVPCVNYTHPKQLENSV